MNSKEEERLHNEAVRLLQRSGFGVIEGGGEAVIVISPNTETLYGPRSTATRYASPHIAIKQLLEQSPVTKEIEREG